MRTLMYGKVASKRKQEIDLQQHIIPKLYNMILR